MTRHRKKRREWSLFVHKVHQRGFTVTSARSGSGFPAEIGLRRNGLRVVWVPRDGTVFLRIDSVRRVESSVFSPTALFHTLNFYTWRPAYLDRVRELVG